MRPMLGVIVGLAAALATSARPAAEQTASRAAARFPNVSLVTHEGQTVRFYDDLVRGKIVAINLIYTTCKYACPLETARLAQVQRVLGDRMGRDVFFYSISIDPEHDTPAVLKEYARTFHAGPGWLFLTGDRQDIDLVSRRTGLTGPTPTSGDGHAPSLLVGNDTTDQWMRLAAADNAKFLARTIGDWLNSWRGPKRALPSYANARTLAFQRGEYTFKAQCAACHTIGEGDRVGPDLRGVTRVRDRSWLTRYILQPEVQVANGDPIATALLAKYRVRMPNLALEPAEVDAVLDYIDKANPPVRALDAPASRRVAMPDAFLAAYVRAQEALSGDTLEGIGDAARVMSKEAASLGTSGDALASAASGLQQSVDLPSARDAFGRLSDAIVALTGTSGSAVGDGFSVVYCPMTRHYWLQRGTAIRNPYYGPRMLECGRIITALPN